MAKLREDAERDRQSMRFHCLEAHAAKRWRTSWHRHMKRLGRVDTCDPLLGDHSYMISRIHSLERYDSGHQICSHWLRRQQKQAVRRSVSRPPPRSVDRKQGTSGEITKTARDRTSGSWPSVLRPIRVGRTGRLGGPTRANSNLTGVKLPPDEGRPTKFSTPRFLPRECILTRAYPSGWYRIPFRGERDEKIRPIREL